VVELRRGVRYVDAPASGKAPRLSVLAGCAAGTLGPAEAILGDVTSDIIYTGQLGDGSATKLIH
jgi:3-hydroxyisobutyrate dehydrogenase-like beta-hydroxyacid dehydrogenase